MGDAGCAGTNARLANGQSHRVWLPTAARPIVDELTDDGATEGFVIGHRLRLLRLLLLRLRRWKPKGYTLGTVIWHANQADEEWQEKYKEQHRPSASADDDTISAEELMRLEFPPVRFVVAGYIVEGLTVLAGRPKGGKSWLAYDICIAVAVGGEAMGAIQCEQGDVLYLCLEDNRRRAARPAARLADHYADLSKLHPDWLLLAGQAELTDRSGTFAREWIAKSVVSRRLDPE